MDGPISSVGSSKPKPKRKRKMRAVVRLAKGKRESSSCGSKPDSLPPVKKRPAKKKMRRVTDSDSDPSAGEKNKDSTAVAVTENREVWALPPEIWAKIFEFLAENPISLYLKFARICSVFRKAARVGSLWRKVDFGVSGIWRHTEAREFFSHFVGKRTQHLGFEKCTRIRVEQIKELITRAPNLKSLDLSDCHTLAFNAAQLFTLLGSTKLENLTLSRVNPQPQGKCPKFATCLQKYLEHESAASIKRIRMDGNYLPNFLVLMKNANRWKCGENLLELDESVVSHRRETIVPLSSIAQHTPNLKIFRMGETRLLLEIPNAQASVWPHLEELELTAGQESHAQTNQLKKLVSLCGNGGLRSLCLDVFTTDSHMNAVDVLESAHNYPLTHLSMKSAAKDYAATQRVLDLIANGPMPSTLIDVDLSWAQGDQLANKFCDMIIDYDGDVALQRLSLVGCTIDAITLRDLINRCKSLNWLDVCSCRSLPRGVKRVYENRKDIKELAKLLLYRDFIQENCPSGLVSLAEFKEMYANFFVNSTSSNAELVFNTFDQDGNGQIRFEGDKVEALSLVLHGTEEEKLERLFETYDCKQRGYITEQDMREVVKSIYELMGHSFRHPIQADDFMDHMQGVFHRLDKNNDGKLTLEKFLDGCKTDPAIRKSLVLEAWQ